MKNLICRLLFATCLFFVLAVMTFVVMVFVYRTKFDKVLRPSPCQDILFVGSSQIGCSIVEDLRYHNKVLWTADRPMQSVAVCVRAMEERGFLDNIKVLCIRVNRSSIVTETPEKLAAAWYRELPISWCCGASYSLPHWELLKYLIAHMAWPIKWQVLAGRATGRRPVSQQTQAWRENLIKEMKVEGADVKGLIPNWKEETLAAYASIQETCRRKGIRLVGVDFPYFRDWTKCIGEELRLMTNELVNDIKTMGVEVVSFPEGFSDDYFFDMVHMTEDGAELFTKVLYEKLELEVKGKDAAR